MGKASRGRGGSGVSQPSQGVRAGLGYKTGNLAHGASGKSHLGSERLISRKCLIYGRLTVSDFSNTLGSWLGLPHTSLGKFYLWFPEV